jgi:hypothetical protein
MSADTFVDAIARARRTLFIADGYAGSAPRGWRPDVAECATDVKIRYLCNRTSGAIKNGVAEETSYRGENFEARWISVPEFSNCVYFVDDTECWTVWISSSHSVPPASDYGRSLRTKYEDLWLRAIDV